VGLESSQLQPPVTCGLASPGKDGGPPVDSESGLSLGEEGESPEENAGEVGAGGCGWLAVRPCGPAVVMVLLMLGMIRRKHS